MRGARLTCCCESSEVGHLRKTRRFEEGFLEKDWPKAGIRKHTSRKVQGDGQKGRNKVWRSSIDVRLWRACEAILKCLGFILRATGS